MPPVAVIAKIAAVGDPVFEDAHVNIFTPVLLSEFGCIIVACCGCAFMARNSNSSGTAISLNSLYQNQLHPVTLTVAVHFMWGTINANIFTLYKSRDGFG